MNDQPKRPADPTDGLATLGFLLIVTGCALVAVPLALVVGGTLLLAAAIVSTFRRRGGG